MATPMAAELHGALVTLTSWAERHREAIAAARVDHDTRQAAVAAD